VPYVVRRAVHVNHDGIAHRQPHSDTFGNPHDHSNIITSSIAHGDAKCKSYKTPNCFTSGHPNSRAQCVANC